MGDPLGGGLTLEDVAERLQPRSQLFVVLDDSVVDECDSSAARRLSSHATGRRRAGREVRSRVGSAWRTVCGPACVGDSGERREFLRLAVEFGDARDAARAFQLAVRVNRDATRVIAAVLEAPQPLDQNRDDVALGYRSDDAAHGSLLSG